MKTRNLLVLLSVIFFGANNLFATELVVQQNGPVGTYASISAAISAAVDNDIIVINNRQDGLPWIENLSINKSLTFVSAVDNAQWWMEGNLTVTVANNRVITIVGMRNSLATATMTKSSSSTSKTLVNMMYCDFAGDITLTSNVEFYLGSSKASAVSFSCGKVIGNDLRSLTVPSDPSPISSFVNTIVGNRIGYWLTSNIAFSHSSTSNPLFFSNNLVKCTSATGSVISGIYPVGVNRIVNSSFVSTYVSTGSSTAAAFYVSSGTGNLTLENCTFGGSVFSSSSTLGANGLIFSNASTTSITPLYNIYYNPASLNNSGETLSTSLGNFASTAVGNGSISTAGVISGTVHVNLGNPSNAHLDLDLSRNDIGCYGGSYSMENFWPLMSNAESSRVNYAVAPRVVNQGGVMNVTATGFDK